MKNNMHLNVILKEMCNRVGAKNVDFKSDNWYWQYNWTTTEENSFIEWLTDYLYKTPKARKEIMSPVYGSKKACRNTAVFFVSFYGWKVNDFVDAT